MKKYFGKNLMVIIDIFSELKYGPHHSIPKHWLWRMVIKRIPGETEFSQTIENGIERGLLIYTPGGTLSLGSIALTENGYKKMHNSQ